MQYVRRANEIEVIERSVDRGTSSPQFVAVVGNQGTGKSTLLDQTASRAEELGMWVVRGSCGKFGTGPMADSRPFDEILAELLHADEGTDAPTKAGTGVAKATARFIVNTAPELMNLFFAPAGFAAHCVRLFGRNIADRIPELPPPSSSAELFRKYWDLLCSVAQTTPLVLLIDDLHTANEETLALLGHVASGVASGSGQIIIVAAMRPPRSGQLRSLLYEVEADQSGRLWVVDCNQVTRNAAESFAANLADGMGLSLADQELTDLVGLTGGNAYLIGRCLQVLKLSHAEGRPVEVKSLATHDSIDASALSARLVGECSELSQRALRVGAISGPVFCLDHVAEVLERQPLEVAEALQADAVDRFRLVRHAETPLGFESQGLRFMAFDHGLVQEALAESQIGPVAQMLHARFADLGVRDSNPDTLDYRFIASHRFGAGDETGCAKALAVEVRRLTRRQKFRDATQLAAYALKVCPETEHVVRFELLVLQSRAAGLGYELPLALSATLEAESIAHLQEDPLAIVQVLLRMATAQWKVRQLDDAERTILRGFQAIQEHSLGDEAERDKLERSLWMHLGVVAARSSQLDEALSHYKKAERHGSDSPAFDRTLANNLAALRKSRGEFGDALGLLSACVNGVSIDKPDSLALYLTRIADVQGLMTGDAIATSAKAVDAARRCGAWHRLVDALHTQAWAYRMQDQDDVALGCLREAQGLLASIDPSMAVHHLVRSSLSNVLAGGNRASKAESQRIARDAYNQWHRFGDDQFRYLTSVHLVKGISYLAHRPSSRAVRSRSIDLFEQDLRQTALIPPGYWATPLRAAMADACIAIASGDGPSVDGALASMALGLDSIQHAGLPLRMRSILKPLVALEGGEMLYGSLTQMSIDLAADQIDVNQPASFLGDAE